MIGHLMPDTGWHSSSALGASRSLARADTCPAPDSAPAPPTSILSRLLERLSSSNLLGGTSTCNYNIYVGSQIVKVLQILLLSYLLVEADGAAPPGAAAQPRHPDREERPLARRARARAHGGRSRHAEVLLLADVEAASARPGLGGERHPVAHGCSCCRWKCGTADGGPPPLSSASSFTGTGYNWSGSRDRIYTAAALTLLMCV